MGGGSLKLLLDTHVWVRLIFADRRLDRGHQRRIERAIATGDVFVSPISAWEVALLHRKGRLRLDRAVGQWIDEALAVPGLNLAPFTPAIAVAGALLPDSFHGDPADRILVATAIDIGARLLTADERILAYARAATPGILP